jgi:hypothetical protein
MVYKGSVMPGDVRSFRLHVSIAALVSVAWGPSAFSQTGALPDEPPIRFEEASAGAGVGSYRNLFGVAEKPYIIESTGNGAAWLDYDNDGRLDLFVANGSTLDRQAKGTPGPGNSLYHNEGDGKFSDVTEKSGLKGGYWGSAVAAGDYDNDGLTDLFVTTVLESNHLYRNNGNGTFTDATSKAGVGGGTRSSASAAWLDHDRDGDLDLFVTNYVTFDPAYIDKVSPYCLWKGLRVYCGPVGVPADGDTFYRNNGDGTFSDATSEAGLDKQKLKSLGVVAADFDGDGLPDLYVAADSTINALFRNKGDGTFEDVSLLSGAGYSQDGRAQSGMGVDVGDYDGDGRPDLFVTNFQDDYNTLYRNEGGFLLTDVTNQANLAQASFTRLGWGTAFRDFDNDGLLDLFVANGHVYPQVDAAAIPESYAQQNQLFRNTGRGRFADVTAGAGGAMQVIKGSRGAAFADYDNDGRMDLVIVNIDDSLSLLRNATTNDHHWLTVQLVGVRSNRAGLGASLKLKVGNRTLIREIRTSGSYASSNDPRAHFGLGSAESVESLVIEWPSGKRQKLETVPVDRILVVHEDSGPEGPE